MLAICCCRWFWLFSSSSRSTLWPNSTRSGHGVDASESRSPTWTGPSSSTPGCSLRKGSDTEVAGEDLEHLEGVFGLRMRVVRMRLGDEFIELTEYLAPKGRPDPR